MFGTHFEGVCRAHIDQGRLLSIREDYANASVMLMDIEPAEVLQQELFPAEEEVEKGVDLISSLDSINARFGRVTLKTGSIGFHDRQNWSMRQERKTIMPPAVSSVITAKPVGSGILAGMKN